MDFNIAPCKKRSQIRTQQKCIGAGQVDIVFFLGVESVDSQLKLRAHLHLVHEKIVRLVCLILCFHIGVQCMVLLDFLKGQIHKVDINDIAVIDMAFQVFNIGLHQFGLAGSAYPGDDFDVRCAVQFDDSL